MSNRSRISTTPVLRLQGKCVSVLGEKKKKKDSQNQNQNQSNKQPNNQSIKEEHSVDRTAWNIRASPNQDFTHQAWQSPSNQVRRFGDNSRQNSLDRREGRNV
jgi:hypothetical protein